jgi:photosystem II stability/assembly factor-like uncharacterized protein
MKRNCINSLKMLPGILCLFLLYTCHRIDEPINIEEPAEAIGWHQVFQDSGATMLHIRFSDENTGFVYAYDFTPDTAPSFQYIYHTRDGGKTWIKYACRFPQNSSVLTDFTPLNQDTLIGIGKSVYKSTNGGKNWKNMYPTHDDACTIWDICAINSTDWIFADCDSITLTKNGGVSWTQAYLTEFMSPFAFLSFSFPTNTVGYVCGAASHGHSYFGFIAKTTDGGLNWVLLQPKPWSLINSNTPDVKTFQFINEQTGFIFTNDGKLYKTTDGADNWTLINSSIRQLWIKSCFLTENVGYYFALNGIYKTTDGGISWREDYLIPLDLQKTKNSYIMDICFSKSGDGYVGTRDGRIFKKNHGE